MIPIPSCWCPPCRRQVHQYIRPLLFTGRGRNITWKTITAMAGGEIVNNGKRTNFIRVKLEQKQGQLPQIIDIKKQGSHMLSSIVNADGYIILESGKAIQSGETVNVKEILPTLKNGAFAENIITRGINLTTLQVGDRLQVGDQVVLEITQIGKECHNSGCAIKKATGDCIMPREGIFSRVIKGGTVVKEDIILEQT